MTEAENALPDDEKTRLGITRRQLLEAIRTGTIFAAGAALGRLIPTPDSQELASSRVAPERDVERSPTLYLDTRLGPFAEWIKKGDVELIGEPQPLRARPSSLKDKVREDDDKNQVLPVSIQDLEHSTSIYKPTIDLEGEVLFQHAKITGSGETGAFGIVTIPWTSLMGGYTEATIKAPWPPQIGLGGKSYTRGFRVNMLNGPEQIGLLRQPIKDAWQQKVEIIIVSAWDPAQPLAEQGMASEATDYFLSKLGDQPNGVWPSNILAPYYFPKKGEPNLGLYVDRYLALGGIGLSTPPKQSEQFPIDNPILRRTEQEFEVPLYQVVQTRA